MQRFLVVLVVLFTACGIAFAKDFEVRKKAGAYDVEVRIDKNPPVVGDNGVTVKVRDAAGKNVTDAKVRVDYSMPAMPGMPPMNYKADAALSEKEYKTTMNLSMAGPWNIAVKIMRDGKTATMKFSIDVR